MYGGGGSSDRHHQEILSFSNLQTLYLHANKITSITEVQRLQQLPKLKALTLHGNPVVETKNYKKYVMVVMVVTS